MSTTFTPDLTQFDDDYAATGELPATDFAPIPDGPYQVVVREVTLGEARESGTPLLKWQLRIVAGQYAGRMLFRHNAIGTRENLRWLKRDLAVCGLFLEKLSELPERLGELAGVALEVRKRTRHEFENVYLNRRIELGSDAGVTQHATADVVPF